MLCQFLLYSKVNWLHVYIYALFFGFPSHLGHHRALSRVPCATQWVLLRYLLYIYIYVSILYTASIVYICQFHLLIHPIPPCPLSIQLFFLKAVYPTRVNFKSSVFSPLYSQLVAGDLACSWQSRHAYGMKGKSYHLQTSQCNLCSKFSSDTISTSPHPSQMPIVLSLCFFHDVSHLLNFISSLCVYHNSLVRSKSHRSYPLLTIKTL